MKKICRFLAMLLLLTIVLTPCVLAVDTSAEATLKGAVSSVSGATRYAEDLEGESFSVQKRLTPAITGTTFSTGATPDEIRTDSLKFGHLRTMTSTDGTNTYAEWRFHQADGTTINGSEDAYITLGKRSYVIDDYSYQVLEFDLTTMTTFPSNLWIFSEWRGSDNTGKERVKFGSYNDEDGLWHFGDKTLEIKQNEWVHITLVFALRNTGTGASDYSTTVARIFINGEFFNEIIPYPSASLKDGVSMKQHYIGVGWPYGKAGARTGMDENPSVCIDNVTLTTLDRSSYSGNLEQVFADNFTNLSAFSGKEIVYTPTYTFPSSALAAAAVTDKNGNKTYYTTAEAAVAYIKENALTDAKLTLLADQYFPLEITAPLTLDTAGHTLWGDAVTADNIVLSSVNGTLWSFTRMQSKNAQVLFYQSPYDKRITPVADYLLDLGDTLPSITPAFYVDEATGTQLEPTGNWIAYDSKGNRISTFTKITSAHIGNVYTFCPEYLSADTVLTLIRSDGTTEQHTTTDVLAKIPSGATVILRRDLPCPTSIYGTDYKLDLNGYTVYAVDGNKQEIIRGMGTVCVYSSRKGARIFTGTQMPNGKDENGNTKYSNQAGFVVSDAGSTAGSKYMLGYMSTTAETPYTIDIFCGAFSQLGSSNNTSVYLKKLNIISAAGDNKGIFTTRYERSGRYWQIDDCSIIISNGKGLCANVNTGSNTGKYVFNNTNIFGNGTLFGIEGKVTADCTVTFNNTNVYGSHSINSGTGSYTDTSSGTVYNYNRTLIINTPCYLSDLKATGVILPDGYMFIPKVTGLASGSFLYPDAARYINFSTGKYTYVGGSYSSRGYIGKLEEFSSAILRSVSIDTSVSLLIYLPTSSSLEGVYVDEVNYLNISSTKVVNGNDYFVIRIAIPPKEAYKTRSATIRFTSGSQQITLDASLLSYAEGLEKITDTSATGTYYADSKALMRYVLYYIRTAATTLGSASTSDLARLDAILGTFSLSSSDKTITESVYSTTSVSGKLTAATLNLDAKVGMVFQVAKGYVGTVRVDMPYCTSIVKTYTADAPASAEEYIVLRNIPAHALRENVTVTLTPAQGSATTFTYNLATYVNGTKTNIAYAVYAYAKAANGYRAKYPSASVYED